MTPIELLKQLFAYCPTDRGLSDYQIVALIYEDYTRIQIELNMLRPTVLIEPKSGVVLK